MDGRRACGVSSHIYGVFLSSSCLQGSLKDLIYRNKAPKNSFMAKYCGAKSKGIDIRAVRLYGRQVLEVC